jgi:glycosyltransferase involved in cell wall biosynthesis
MPAAALLRLWQHADVPAVESFTGEVDVVHGTNYVVPPAHRAGAVVTVYDLTSVRFPELCAPASLRYPGLVRRAVERGALVHVLASAIGDEVHDLLGVPRDRIRVVPSGIDEAAGGDAGAGHRLAGSDEYVLALGTVEPRKRVDDLVRAFDRIAGDRPSLRLVVAGPDGWGIDSFLAAMEASPFASRIRRIGWVHASARADLLAGASVLAVPSVYEGFGYPPLEAMAAGTPVVTTTAGSLPEVVGDAALLVPPRDVDALAAALCSVLDDDGGLRADLRRRGLARAATFRWDECAARLVGVYREVAA